MKAFTDRINRYFTLGEPMFKLVLLDFCLQDMDGPEIYKRIKEAL